MAILINNEIGSGLRPATLLKKRLWHRCFPVNIAKFLRTSFLTGHLWWLLLYIILFFTDYRASKVNTAIIKTCFIEYYYFSQVCRNFSP